MLDLRVYSTTCTIQRALCLYALDKEVRGFCFDHICQKVCLYVAAGYFFRPCNHLKGLLRRSVGGIYGYKVNSHNVILVP